MNPLKLSRRAFLKASAASMLARPLPPHNGLHVLPPPDFDNSFYMLPIFESWHVRNPSDIPLRTREAEEMMKRLGPQRPYLRLGFAIISTGAETDTYALAEKLGICLVLQGGATDHHIGEWGGENLIIGPEGDRRNAQWLENGEYLAETAGAGFRLRACLSVYCRAVHDLRHQADARRASQVAASMRRFPETVVGTSGPIEVETQMEGHHFGDYSPFTIAEFRDWLTHRGIYDDRRGARKERGFPGGKRWRNDPDPSQHKGTGPSFNEYFGTNYKSWTLQYWDIEKYPNRLAVEAPGMPKPGDAGFTEGGFDAPRVENPGDLFWQAWSSSDLHHPGFRQILVQEWVADATRWLHEAGIPKKRIFSHQVPGQSYGNLRLMLGASPSWTAATPNGSIGITTYFGAASDTASFTQIVDLDPNWGIFEYHPFPINSLAAPPGAYTHSLNVCLRFRSHILTPISWQKSPHDFIVRTGPFAEAIQLLFATLPDRPYFDRSSRRYTAPLVQKVRLAHFGDGHRLSWSPYIWPGMKWRWSDLRGFQKFQVWDGDRLVAETSENRHSVPAGGRYRVTAQWNEIAALPPIVPDIRAEQGVLSWTEPGGMFVQRYRIEFAADKDWLNTKWVTTTANEFPLPAGEREYYCRVLAVNGDGTAGPPSSVVRVVMPVTSKNNLPPVADVLAYGKNMSGKVLLSWSDRTPSGVKWQDMPGFVTFCIYHGANRSLTPSPANLMAKTRQNRYMDPHFSAEKPWYRITALFQDGQESPPSEGVAYVP
ncbi:MAG: fibronectin type III domain-containing protein [Armatimonadetes bacterium]|nr:fibronectin type III domain-containing protein [Armatimonadota bacterium]